MLVENAVIPNQKQMEEFTEPGPDGPMYMLNYVRPIQQ